MMPTPHGGRLVDRVLSERARERYLSEIRDLPKVQPFIDQIYDVEKIAIGAYSPLEGFMDSATLDSVLSRSRLPSDLAWSIPIVFAPGEPRAVQALAQVRSGGDVLLLDDHERPFAVLHVTERYRIDRGKLAQSAFGTTDPTHPNVADVMSGGEEAFAGPIDLLRRLDLPAGPLELTPAETREEFRRRGWKHVAAYQCRNPPHTAHEYLQRNTLERDDVDGLLVQPVVGRLKKGDYRPDVILAAYKALIKEYYPPDRVFLSSLSITMRYAGPKAALFFAIVRKNFGCSHYIVGRDQAGVGTFYDPYACHRVFDDFDVGVVPLRYEETFFCRKCGWMATPKTCAHPVEDHVATSQTRIRTALAKGEPLPMEIIRPEVAKVLQGTDNVLD
jgi:sulfate adenylyltransferase